MVVFIDSLIPKQKNYSQAIEEVKQSLTSLPSKKLSDASNQSKNSKLETSFIELSSIVGKLKLPTQGARIQKLMAERVCEFVFLLRRSQQFICNEMF